jgi:hypothetical protein
VTLWSNHSSQRVSLQQGLLPRPVALHTDRCGSEALAWSRFPMPNQDPTTCSSTCQLSMGSFLWVSLVSRISRGMCTLLVDLGGSALAEGGATWLPVACAARCAADMCGFNVSAHHRTNCSLATWAGTPEGGSARGATLAVARGHAA